MLCSNCDSDQMIEDDTTGQLICVECGTATGLFTSLSQIQGQDFVETRGLRVMYKPSTSGPHKSKNCDNTITHQSIASAQIFTDLFDGNINSYVRRNVNDLAANSLCEQVSSGTCGQFLSGDHLDDLLKSDLSAKKLQKMIKSKSRPWRLCEPFTYIMRCQTESIINLFDWSSVVCDRFRNTVWQLWTHYLAITGELGEQAWLEAVQLPVISLLAQYRHRNRLSVKTQYSAATPIDNRKLTVREWYYLKHRLSQFQWPGWSTLYEPDEGREAMEYLKLTADNVHDVVRRRKRQILKTNTMAKRLRYADAPSPTSISANPSHIDVDIEKSRKSSRPVRKRLVRHSSSVIDGPKLATQQLNKSRKITYDERDDTKGQAETQDYGDTAFGTNDVGDGYTFTSNNIAIKPDATQLSIKGRFDNVPPANLRRSLAKKRLRTSSCNRLFWRGKLMNVNNTHVLLEHNLALLFIACLTTSPTRSELEDQGLMSRQNALVNTIYSNTDYPNTPKLLTSMVTLKDLVDFCIEQRLPFICIENHFPPGAFAVHDRYLLSHIRRNRAPQVDQLAHVTVHMLELNGIHNLPKFPLCWLIHRHLIALGLPFVLHGCVGPLLFRLQKRSRLLSKALQHNLFQHMPWPRIVRPEVFAMGLVIILLRLVFKLDDVYEYRLSDLAKALESSNCAEADYHRFDWLQWTNYIQSRFYSSRNLHKTHLSNSPYSKARHYSNSTAPIFTAGHDAELRDMEAVEEFLGSNEFKLGVSVGWGEANWKPIKIATSTTKLAMTQTLRNLYTTDADEYTNPILNNAQNYEHFTTGSSAKSDQLNDFGIFAHFIGSPIEQVGLSSPYRWTQLDFVFNSEVINNHPVSFTAKQSYPNLDQYWADLVDRRTNYYPICTGEWEMFSEAKAKQRNRRRFKESISLPQQVTNLLNEHEHQLSGLLDTAANGLINGEIKSQSNDATNVVGVTDVSSTTQFCIHCRKPSDSLRWILEICSFVCDATNYAVLLDEVECLERLLKWGAIKTCCFSDKLNDDRQVKLSDCAMLSCFDLNSISFS